MSPARRKFDLATLFCYVVEYPHRVSDPAIRDACPEDFEELWKIDRLCFVEGISYSRQELQFYLGLKRAFTLMAELEGKIVGYVLADRDRKNQGHIITIDVLPEARRAGVGTALMEAAEQRLRVAGCSLVVLEAAVDNPAALAFYKRHRYTVVNSIPRYYLDSIDALVLAKELGPLPPP